MVIGNSRRTHSAASEPDLTSDKLGQVGFRRRGRFDFYSASTTIPLTLHGGGMLLCGSDNNAAADTCCTTAAGYCLRVLSGGCIYDYGQVKLPIWWGFITVLELGSLFTVVSTHESKDNLTNNCPNKSE